MEQPRLVERRPSRLHVGGLKEGVGAGDLSALFGKVPGIDVESVAVARGRGFAYLDVLASDRALRSCSTMLSGTSWRGGVLRVGIARPDFRARLKSEWAEEDAQATEKTERYERDRALEEEYDTSVRESNFGYDEGPIYLSIRTGRKGQRKRVIVAVGGPVDRAKRRRVVEEAAADIAPKPLADLEREYSGPMPIGSRIYETVWCGNVDVGEDATRARAAVRARREEAEAESEGVSSEEEEEATTDAAADAAAQASDAESESESESESEDSDGPPPLSMEAWSAVGGAPVRGVRGADPVVDAQLRASAMEENARMQALLAQVQTPDDILRLRGGGDDSSDSDSGSSDSSDSSGSSRKAKEGKEASEGEGASSDAVTERSVPALMTSAVAAQSLFTTWKQPRRFNPNEDDAPKPTKQMRPTPAATKKAAALEASAAQSVEEIVPVSEAAALPPAATEAPKIAKTAAFSSVWAEEGEKRTAKLAGTASGSFSFGFGFAPTPAAAVVESGGAASTARQSDSAGLLRLHASSLEAAEALLVADPKEDGGRGEGKGRKNAAAAATAAAVARPAVPVDYIAQAAAVGFGGCDAVVKLSALARDRGVGARFRRTLNDEALEEQWLASRFSLTAEFKYRSKAGKRREKKVSSK